MRKFSPEIEKFLNNLESDIFTQFKSAKAPRKRQPRRTITLSPEVYERLKDYAARHNQSISEVANFKLDLSISTMEDEAEFEVLSAMYDAQQHGILSQYVN